MRLEYYAEQPLVGMGEIATTPNFEYVVIDSPEEADEATGSRYTHTAEGRHVIVNLTVTNTGSEPGYLSGHRIQLFDDDRSAYFYEVDSTSTSTPSISTEKLDPGQTETFDVVFDLPTGREPEQLVIIEGRGAAAEDTAVMSLVE